MAKPRGVTPRPDISELTPRQRRILEVIKDAVVLRGYPPSIREIGDAVGLQSTSSVAYQLNQLEQKGFLRRDPNKPRAVDLRQFAMDDDPKPGRKAAAASTEEDTLPETASGVNYIPVVGRIAAGAPITAEENVDAYYPLPDEIVGKGELYMLKVVGESMKDAAILDGDWVIIRSQPTAESGDFVAALLDNEEATVKEFHQDSSGIWLLPHNEAFAPIPGDNATIMGKVVSVIRKI